MHHPTMEDYLFYLNLNETAVPLQSFLAFSAQDEWNSETKEQYAWEMLMYLQKQGYIRIELPLPGDGDIQIRLTEQGGRTAKLAAEVQIEAMLSDWYRTKLSV